MLSRPTGETMRPILMALLTSAMLAGLAFADPNPQLVLSVQQRLDAYGLDADVSQFATATVAELHLALSSRHSFFKTRDELRNILRRAKYK